MSIKTLKDEEWEELLEHPMTGTEYHTTPDQEVLLNSIDAFRKANTLSLANLIEVSILIRLAYEVGIEEGRSRAKQACEDTDI